jgi:hypothetical protein
MGRDTEQFLAWQFADLRMPKSRKRSRGKHSVRKRRINPLEVDRMFDVAMHRGVKRNAPEVLYHYTTWAALEGILKSQRFRATAHDCTNDDAELKSADSVIMEMAKGLNDASTGNARTVLSMFLEGYPTLRITHLTDVYLSCFSVARDLESQWRTYADNGQGVCLGIKVLDEAGPRERRRGTAIIKVEYAESDWRANFSDGIQQICQVLNRVYGSNQVLESGLFACYRIAAHTAMSAKLPSYAVEQEYRRVTLLHKDAKVVAGEYTSNGKVRQYIPTVVRAGGNKIALSEVMVGPNKEFKSAVQRVREILAVCGYTVDEMEYPKITQSAVEPWLVHPNAIP